jgi:hypothetical protein
MIAGTKARGGFWGGSGDGTGAQRRRSARRVESRVTAQDVRDEAAGDADEGTSYWASQPRTSCEEYGHDFEIVDSHGDTNTYRCTDCGYEYED